ncbi:MAG TPA: efflux RND transporter periplasmic adaptor subunit [Vicinamibacteria bacterium]|jgi:membrane fusion protein (multidrug efflux system)
MEVPVLETAPPPSRRRRLVIAIAATAIAVAGLAVLAKSRFAPGKVEASTAPAAAAKEEGKDKPKEPPVVAVAVVERGPIAAFTSATANLVAEDEVKVVAETEGRVMALHAEEGHDVAKGQALLRIDPADAALALRKAELALQNAQVGLDRAERMHAASLMSGQDLDKARFERDIAQQTLAESRRALVKTTVAAPFSGKVTLRRVQVGQTVKRGDELFTVADFQPLVARIFLPEREVLDLAVGQEVRLSLRAREDMRFRGRIQQISPVVDTASGTVKITVEAVQPPAQVRPGAFVTVDVLREARPSALLVPRQAVIRELQETYVYVAEGTQARKRTVSVGLEEGDRLEVTAGLQQGEKVITSGQGGLRDQSPIAVAGAPAAPAPSTKS